VEKSENPLYLHGLGLLNTKELQPYFFLSPWCYTLCKKILRLDDINTIN